MNKLNFIYYEFTQDLVDPVEIVSDLDPEDIIRILRIIIIELGCHSKQVFEEIFLYKVYQQDDKIVIEKV